MKITGFLSIFLILLTAQCADVPHGDLMDSVKADGVGRINVTAVFSHPDDESFYTGGTLLKMKKNPAVRLHIVCLTNGNKDEAKDNLGVTEERLAVLRIRELEYAAHILGADSVDCLDYDDQGLASADRKALMRRIIDALARTKADIVITHDPYGISGHPDHIVCSAVTSAAFQASRAQRLYYVTMTPARYRFNLIFALSDDPAERSRPTIAVDISGEKTMKKLALYSHVTQHHFSFWNALGMYEDLLFDHEHFKLVASRSQ